MFRRGSILLSSYPAITLIAASIIIHVKGSAGAQLPFAVLTLFPDSGDLLSRRWDQALSSSSITDSVSVSSITITNTSGEVLNTLCKAVEKHQPMLLLSFLNAQDSIFARILSASTFTPLLSASQEYSPAGLVTRHPQVRGTWLRNSRLCASHFEIVCHKCYLTPLTAERETDSIV